MEQKTHLSATNLITKGGDLLTVPHSAHSKWQVVQQRPGVFRVGGIESFGKPAVDFGQHGTRLVAARTPGCLNTSQSETKIGRVIA
jgi:hypothetical protein